MNDTLKAFVINCTLKASPSDSSTDKLARELLAAFKEQHIEGSMLRIADYNVKPGVETDMGNGDEWPKFRADIHAADILIIATPIWMGHMSSFAQQVLERLDGELSEKDDQGRLKTYGKVAGVAVVGNEDGAHHASAELFQGLNDVGFSLAPGAVVYWVGEAMQTTDYKDLDQTPDAVTSTTKSLAIQTTHLARLLKNNPFPPTEQ
jgi:multimeric flavodoxin WrbA